MSVVTVFEIDLDLREELADIAKQSEASFRDVLNHALCVYVAHEIANGWSGSEDLEQDLRRHGYLVEEEEPAYGAALPGGSLEAEQARRNRWY